MCVGVGMGEKLTLSYSVREDDGALRKRKVDSGARIKECVGGGSGCGCG